MNQNLNNKFKCLFPESILTGLTLLFILFSPDSSNALQTLTVSDGETAFVNISQSDLNVIRFQTPGIQVFTTSPMLDIKVVDRNVFVSIFDEIQDLRPGEVFFVTAAGTFSLILVPKDIPAETIAVQTGRESVAAALEFEKSHDYVSLLKDLIQAMYREIPPMGYSVKESYDNATMWADTRMTLVSTYTGAALVGKVYELSNLSEKPVSLIEKSFYEEGVLAVSIDKHEIQPEEQTKVYLVKRSETQNKMSQFMRKFNPLDVLKEQGPEGE